MKEIEMAQVGAFPAYDQPPVAEVALAIQLESAIGFRSFQLGQIAENWTSELPIVQERPALPPMVIQPEAPSLALHVSGEAETPRLWLMSEAGDRLVQIQQDRLVVNWRKLPIDTPYPHYSAIREFLVDTWQKLGRTTERMGLVVPQPSVCEVVYVNHIGVESDWNSAADTSTVIAPWSGLMSDDFLPPVSQAGFFLRYQLPDGYGWLTIDGQSVSVNNNEDQFVVNMVSRGPAISPDLNGALGFMDIAHEWIVRGFTSVTTPEAHEAWRRTI
ncbi:MAG: TIGR04255 family protein [bacterium]|nr:TIGR04255 family protein [bacterium]